MELEAVTVRGEDERQVEAMRVTQGFLHAGGDCVFVVQVARHFPDHHAPQPIREDVLLLQRQGGGVVVAQEQAA